MSFSSTSLWNPDNVKDVAESVGIPSLPDNVTDELCRDVDFRLAQVLEEALKFMRHSKRTTLTTQDVSQALKTLNVEPLYGYESIRPLRFGEASIGPGQPLYYVEDEEVDFEKLINQPLPKVPREITFTAHWLAVEGVQPSIPQNPNASNHADYLPKGSGANPHAAAANGLDGVNYKPLVKHVLSKESQELFTKLSSALLDETNSEWQNAALAAMQSDPGIHQLATYLITFISEKVTHNGGNLFILRQMMRAIEALIENRGIYLAPYVAAMVPPVLTCLTSKHLGPKPQSSVNSSSETLNGTSATANSALTDPYELRNLAASILKRLCQKYDSSSAGLKMRIARSCLRQWLNYTKPLGTHYGALHALFLILDNDALRTAIVPNLKVYNDNVLKEAVADESKKPEADRVLTLIAAGLEPLVNRADRGINGVGNLEGMRDHLADKIGDVIADRIVERGMSGLAQALLAADFSF